MKSNNEIRWSNDGKVCFEPVTHTYWNGRKQLKGVTSYITSLRTPFDSTAKAIEKSAKPWELLREWKLKGNKSRDDGTAIHELVEMYFETGVVPEPVTEKEYGLARCLRDVFETRRLTLVEVESICYNDTIATLRDAVVKDEQGRHYILDWKTNEEISHNCYGKYLLDPYKHLPDASYYYYSLQLRLSEQMTRDYKIEDCFIVHIKPNDYEFIKAATI